MPAGFMTQVGSIRIALGSTDRIPATVGIGEATMGTHAFDSSAFLLTLEEFYVLITPAHLSGIRRDATRLMRSRQDEGPELELHAQVISEAASVEGVVTVLRSLVEQSFENYEQEIEDDNILQAVFEAICHVVLPIQPERVAIIRPEHVDMGDDPPTDTPLLWFDFDQCFSIQMTAAGRQLAHTLGRAEIEPLSWSHLG